LFAPDAPRGRRRALTRVPTRRSRRSSRPCRRPRGGAGGRCS
jgi:hypothetical protein